MAIRTVSAVVLLALFGCSKPPAPAVVQPITADHIYSRVGHAGLNMLKWPSGATVLVWTDVDGFCGGGSGPSPAGVAYSWSHREIVTRREARPEPPPGAPRPPGPGPAPRVWNEETGREVHWRCETADGTTGTIVINGEKLDLANGNVFLVATVQGGGVTQLTRDLSALELKHETFAKLAKDDEAIRKFVEAAVPSK